MASHSGVLHGRHSAVAEASRPDIPRSLRLTFEDDLLLPRYQEPIAIQPEPESVTTHNRRDAIIRATACAQPPTGTTPAAADEPLPESALSSAASPLPFPVDGLPSPVLTALPPKAVSPPLVVRGSPVRTAVPASRAQGTSPPLSPARPKAVVARRNNSSSTPPRPVLAGSGGSNISSSIISGSAGGSSSSSSSSSAAWQQSPGRGADSAGTPGTPTGSPSFMAQPLEGSAVGRPRSMSTLKGTSPLALFKKPSGGDTGAAATAAAGASPRKTKARGTTGFNLSLANSGPESPERPQPPTPGRRGPAGGAAPFTQMSGHRAATGDGRRLTPREQQQQQQQQQQQESAVPSPQTCLATPLSSTKTSAAGTKPPQDKSEGAATATVTAATHALYTERTTDPPECTSSPYHATPRAQKRKTNIVVPLQPQQPQRGALFSPLGSQFAGVRTAGSCDSWSDSAEMSGSPCSPVLSPAGDVFGAGHLSSSAASSFSWNERFIEAVERIGALTHSSHAAERLRAYESLARLAGDFTDTVRTYARIIISEVYLPPEQKTIPPRAVGGIVGGDKYVAHGILFKFAVDSQGLYGGDEHAAKVAGHDLKGLVHLYNCWERGVHVPMMAIVDYRGFRVVGMPLLPIDGARTLVYGSSDAGRTIRTCAFLEQHLRSIGEKLNLKAHLVGKQGAALLHTPVDLEGHCGTDGRYYLLDFSRLFPPESPSAAHRMGHLYQLLRPEFVRMYERPLCSDAYSSFTCPNHPDKARRDAAEAHDAEIDAATAYLTGALVEAFAQRLVLLPAEQRAAFPLVERLHEAGINCRHLGRVYGFVANSRDAYWAARLLVEMAARVMRSEADALLRRKMLELRHPGECAYRGAVVLYLNLVLGCSPASAAHWAQSLAPGMAAKFPGFGATALGAAPGAVRECVLGAPARLGLGDGRCLLLRAASRMLGLRFTAAAWALLAHRADAYAHRVAPFTDTDLQELRERVKEMHVASHAAGFVHRMRALLAPQPGERARLLALAAQQFCRALAGNPDNKVTLRNLGDCLLLLDRGDEALDAYRRALAADPGDPNTLYKFAIALDKMGALDGAEEFYLRSLERFPRHSNCCFAYADFLCYQRRDFAEAERFYLTAVDVDPRNADAANNYAVFLVTVRRDYDRADTHFCRALAAAPHCATYVRNYASFMLHIRRNTREADAYADRARALAHTRSPDAAAAAAASPVLHHSVHDIIEEFPASEV